MKLSLVLKRFSIISFVLAIVLFGASCNCKNNNNNKKEYFDNEADTLVFSSQQVDEVFNPFFSTAAADSNVVGMTQIGMLGNDKDGNVVYGDNEAVITKDLQIVTTGTKNVDQITTYYFVVKNNVRFSNGSYLTIKDILFNFYVYLDPVYTGSSTIYSTDIVGLQEYRTQSSSEKEQKSFKEKFQTIADTRVDALCEVAAEIKDDHIGEVLTIESFKEYLSEYTEISDAYANVVEDFEKSVELFKEELESDYSNAIDTYEGITFTDEKGQIHKNLFTTDVEAFLYNEGYIEWVKKDGKLISSLENDVSRIKNYTKEQAINTIFNAKIPDAVDEVVGYWNTHYTLTDFLVNKAMEEFYKGSGARKYENISGIKFANQNEKVTVNGVEYDVPQYNEDGSVKSGNEVLSISIHDIDPKAIWNFALGIAPMYYYSDEEHINKFDFVSNFGVEYASATFMNNVVKAPSKNGVPVGAGAYAASCSSGGITNITKADFCKHGVIYFERNPYFVMGPAKIKKISLQVVSESQMLNALDNKEIDFVEPNAKPETIKQLNSKSSEGISQKSIATAGYGYIGINAGKVPSIAVRQAIMHSINTKECVDYYKSEAKEIFRPMSLSSWAYPTNATSYYPYIGGKIPTDLTVVNPAYKKFVEACGKKPGEMLSKEQQLAFIRQLVEGAGYTLNENGIYVKGSDILKYTFTIAGQETDHPAWQAMFHASEILNQVGFQVNVTPDSQALKKLSSGALTVWAAAWGSTIDPDMYQVYHKDSKATSVLNWGYKQILLNVGGKYDTEYALVEELSEKIDKARQTNDREERTKLYSEALDIVMYLAVELPTYQRKDLFAYNSNKIDSSTLTPDSELSSFKGLTSDLHTVSLNEEK